MRRGFTLIEVVLALALMAVLLSVIQGTYSGVVKARDLSSAETVRVHEIALLLDRMALELSAAFTSSRRSSSTGVVVTKDSDDNSTLSFTTVLPPLPAARRPGGEVVLQYRLEADEESAQWVWRHETGEVEGRLSEQTDTAGSEREGAGRVDWLVRDASRFRVQCYDGGEWVDEWDSTQRQSQPTLPLAISVEIGWRVGEAERTLQTAAPVYGSGGSAQASGSGSTTSGSGSTASEQDSEEDSGDTTSTPGSAEGTQGRGPSVTTPAQGPAQGAGSPIRPGSPGGRTPGLGLGAGSR